MDRDTEQERRKWYELEQSLWNSHTALVSRMRLAEALGDRELVDHLVAAHMQLACGIERCVEQYHSLRPVASPCA